MVKNKNQQPDGENGSLGGRELGSILRDEREKQGLSYAQISEITRLQPHILEALEDGDWDRLPSPVLVKGFIHSYANTLGLEKGKVVEMYQKAGPPKDTLPHPLMEPVKSKKVFFAILILLLVVAAAFYYFWKEHPIRTEEMTSPKTTSPVSVRGSEQTDIQQVAGRSRPIVLNEKNKMNLTHSTDLEAPDTGPVNEPSEGEDESTHSVRGEFPPEYVTDVKSETPELVLKANIRKRTWIKVFVDDREPKEYIFKPGSHPDWRAKKGFELVIGNAGGVELELNGKKIGKLGDPDRVVHLRLPKGYEGRGSQD